MQINSSLPNYLKEFRDCFGDIECLPEKHHIVIDRNHPPDVNPSSRIPYALLKKLKAELDKTVEMKIIQAVNETTDWINYLVLEEKPNVSPRICIDPKELNKAIKRPHYADPTAEDILSRMSGTNYFTKFDASNAYWQIELDEESSKLLTFNSPFGRYQFLRMPYGIHSASDVCQQKIAQIIDGIDGAANSLDDRIIWGSTQQELESRKM